MWKSISTRNGQNHNFMRKRPTLFCLFLIVSLFVLLLRHGIFISLDVFSPPNLINTSFRSRIARKKKKSLPTSWRTLVPCTLSTKNYLQNCLRFTFNLQINKQISEQDTVSVYQPIAIQTTYAHRTNFSLCHTYHTQSFLF